jgi:hypothetical protein
MKNNKSGQEGNGGAASESRGTGRGRGSAANLSHEARVKGGQRSAQVQVRDERGQFAGRSGERSRSRSNDVGGGGGNEGERGGGSGGARGNE